MSVPLLRVVTRLNIGGPARQVLLLTRALAPEYQTTLAAGRPAADEGELGDPTVSVTHVPLVRSLSPAADARALLALRRLLVRTRPEIVHTHMAKAGTLGRVAAATGRGRPRTVHTFHGHVLEGYFRPSVARAFIATERALARRTDVLVAVSDEVRADLLALGIGRPEQYRVIPLGLDLRAHLAITEPSGRLRAMLGLGSETPLVGIVGRLVPIKDHETALRAIAQVPDAHLAIVGDGERRAEVEALVGAMGLGARVHLVGWQHDMPAVLSDLDVVLLTSRNEGTPVSLIEAAACARPAVATDVGGTASVVEDGVTGLLAPAGDANAVATAIADILADPRRGAAMGAAGRDRAGRWSEDRLVADIRALYAGLLG